MGNKTKKRDAQSVIGLARRRQGSIDVCLRADLVAEHDRLDAELARLQGDGGWTATSLTDVNPVIALAQQIAELEAEMLEATVTFQFQALKRSEWETLTEAHPARAQHDERFNWDTFPPALISASLIDPPMTVDEVTALFDEVNEGTRTLLTGAAWDVNQEASTVPFSQRASVVNRWRASSSKQPEPGASPEASSSDV